MREQNKRTTSSGGVLDVTAAIIRDADGASLTFLLDDQTTPKLRSLLIPPCYSQSTAFRKASVPFADTLPPGVEARTLSVSRQSQFRIVVLRLFQQGQVPGQCLGHSTSVKVVESH